MCGIVGLSLAEPNPMAAETLAAMSASITHRGPNSDGVFASEDHATWLGFRRLAIRDLDPRANQPMTSASGRTVVVFNGEIYNSADLAARYCEGLRLRTTGDTEVFLEAFERHGETILPHCNGMFAAAFYDVESGSLTLVRDRMGKKPLYVHEGEGFVAFGSELRTLRGLGLEIDPETVPHYLHFGYFPSPYTFFRNTRQVRPGEVVTLSAGRWIGERRYFDFAELPWGVDATADLPALEHTLRDAVSIRKISDVPLGAFLSGGIDSSLVAAMLRDGDSNDVPTYTIAFDDKKYDEAPFALATAERLGLTNRQFSIGEHELIGLVDEYIDCYEQPYADSSGLPSMLLCRETKRHVTVALSGDGGDEFFGGYTRYEWYRNALRMQRLPSMAQRAFRSLAPRVDRRRGARLSRLLAARDAAGLYANLICGWWVSELDELLPDIAGASSRPRQLVRDHFDRLKCDPLSKAASFDAAYYIPDDLQVKMDRASMRVALEVRSPLLDYRVASMGARLATKPKFARGKKTVLRAMLEKHLPREFFERPKKGFSVPMARWLRGPLHECLTNALERRDFRQSDWINHAQIDRMLAEFRAGRSEMYSMLWMLLALSLSMQHHASAVRFPHPVRRVAARVA